MTIFAGAAGMWPLDARAQQSEIPAIGFLSGGSPNAYADRVTGFRKGLNESGYIEGQDVAIEFRWAQGQYDRLPVFAADLVRQNVAVILSSGGDVAALAAKAATSSIPIVTVSGTDPVKGGLSPASTDRAATSPAPAFSRPSWRQSGWRYCAMWCLQPL